MNNYLIKTINNNEIYEKVLPLKIQRKSFNEDQAHGDDNHIDQIQDQNKSLKLISNENQYYNGEKSSSKR